MLLKDGSTAFLVTRNWGTSMVPQPPLSAHAPCISGKTKLEINV